MMPCALGGSWEGVAATAMTAPASMRPIVRAALRTDLSERREGRGLERSLDMRSAHVYRGGQP